MKKWTLKRWLFLFSVLPCLAVMFLLGGYLTYRQFQVLNDGMRDLGYDITKQLANPRIFSTLAHDHTALQAFINALGEHEEIRSVSLLNSQKQLIGYSGPSYTHQHQPQIFAIHGQNPAQVRVTENKQTLTFSAPIIEHMDVNRMESARKSNNAVNPLSSLPKDAKPVTAPLSDHVVLGWVVVEIDRGYTLIKQYEVMYINFVIMLFGIILLMVLNYRISKRFVTPLVLIQEKIKRLQRGELSWSSELPPHTSFTKTITLSPTKKFSLTFNEFVTIENGLEEISKLLKGKTEQYFRQYEEQTIELQENLAQLEVRNVEIEIDRKNAVKESRIKSELVAGMHHEIRAPLNGLISFVELLAETRLTPYQHEYLTHARIALRQLSTSINELVEAMLFDSNHFLLAKCPVDLRESVDEALLLLAPQAYQNQMELISYIYPDVPVKFLGDAARIKQLILHFGGQLLQLGRNGDLIIRVLNEEQENLSVWLRFEIIAKGLNVTADDYQRLLAFYGDEQNEQQSHTALNTRSFMLAKKLVYAMGGLISVRYEPKDDELAIHFRCCLERLAYREEPLLTKELIHNQRVLIFDENPTAKAALAQQCRFLNLSVLEAPFDLTLEKLIDAIAAGEQEDFDIAILGFNRFIYQEQKFRFLLEQMRQYFKGPIVVAVNTSDARLLEDIEFCGADFCLIKPVGYKKLQTTFYDLLRNYQSQNFHPTPQLASFSAHEARVLVADDNPSNLQRLVYLLNEEGAQVSSACNGQQAIQLATQTDYDLIYLDIKMPDLDGFEVARRIRLLHKSYEHVPIIAVSAYLSEHEEGLLEAAGIDDYIIKPIKRAEVHGSLVKWYRRKHEQEGTEQGTSRIIPFRNLRQNEVDAEDDLLVGTRPNKAVNKTGVRNQWMNTMESDIKAPLNTATLQFNDLKIVDWNAVVLSSNGNAIIAKEILGMLIDSLPEFKEQIYNDYTARDYKKLLDNVHKLHGSASYCGVPRLKEAAYQTEKLLKKEQYDEIAMPIDTLLICIDEVLKVAPDYI